ncbi:hypothetical protein [Microbacterium sp. NPDC089695]|uniref:hypothetical protein n=1 Tax=Microbacterium sp. NPDC089695 TaxID=3364198 RepID=UPI003821C1A3
MNTTDTQNPENTDPENTPNSDRPFGYWLKAVDRLMAAEFATAFDGEHASRRDWRLLNVVDGTAAPRRPLSAHKLHGLVERGWIVADGDGWTLTDDGRAAKDRLGGIVDGIRAKVADAVSPDDLATTIASLEQIARAFGWDEETPLPRGRKHGRGFGRRHGFGPRHGFGRRGFGRPGAPFGRPFGPDFGPDAEHGEHDCGHLGHPGHDRFRRGHGEHPFAGREFAGREFAGHEHDADHAHGDVHGDVHGEHRHGGRGFGGHGHPGHPGARAARMAQHAFERGFDAGYSRGRDA